MGLVDFILNLAGILLWLSWRSVRFDPLTKTSPATLVGTLRRAEPHRLRRWHFLAVLGALLVLRALLYWQIGSTVDWTPSLYLAAVDRSIPFRSDSWWLMLLFSGVSFAITLGLFYLWLLLLSLVNGQAVEPDPLQKLVGVQLGRIDRWPWPVRALLPLLVTLVLWYLLSLLLSRLTLIPFTSSKSHRLEQALVVGLGSYLSWKYLVGGLLALHLVSSYVYLGNQPFWNFISLTGRNLLIPLRRVPLRLGRFDFAPLVGLALVFLVAELAERGLSWLYTRLQV
jgi:uncharacterized protein YggT (Ycf19 family)